MHVIFSTRRIDTCATHLFKLDFLCRFARVRPWRDLGLAFQTRRPADPRFPKVDRTCVVRAARRALPVLFVAACQSRDHNGFFVDRSVEKAGSLVAKGLRCTLAETCGAKNELESAKHFVNGSRPGHEEWRFFSQLARCAVLVVPEHREAFPAICGDGANKSHLC